MNENRSLKSTGQEYSKGCLTMSANTPIQGLCMEDDTSCEANAMLPDMSSDMSRSRTVSLTNTSSAKRMIFFVSDHTGITAENIGRALLAHFPDQQFEYRRCPFIEEVEHVEKIAAEIARAMKNGLQPLIFTTITIPEILSALKQTGAHVFDVLGPELVALEEKLGEKASVMKDNGFHSATEEYFARIDALDFAFNTDDGGGGQRYDQADIILIGVSRVGKTPISFYLSLTYGKRVSNYPLTAEDMESNNMPRALLKHKDKLFGLTIHPKRLHEIRNKRMSGRKYATLQKCVDELQWAHSLFKRYHIPFQETTSSSVEEIAASILSSMGTYSRR